MDAIFSNLQSTAVFIIVLSILIVVHEWGHFITAKKCGVQVDEFSLGFGPILFSKFFNGTTYLIKLFPLGGYVKMAGDDRSKCTGSPEEFFSKSPGQRALIVFNGPLINFVLAYFSFAAVFLIGFPGMSTQLAEVKVNGPAYKAGVAIGDKVVGINDTSVYGWINLETKLEGNSGEPVELKVLRDGKELTFELTPEIIRKPNILGENVLFRDLGISNLSNEVGAVSSNLPAQAAGIQEGDRIIRIDAAEIKSWSDLQQAIKSSQGEFIAFTILRDGKEIQINVAPQLIVRKDESGQDQTVRVVGINPSSDLDYFRFGLKESVAHAWEQLSYITVLTYKSLFRMVTGAMSAKENLTGPVGIFVIVKDAAEAGIAPLLFIMGVISASLAIFNLLPIVPLDGGHLLTISIEKIIGRKLPQKIEENFARVGISFILVLALFAFYNDFDRIGLFKKIEELFLK